MGIAHHQRLIYILLDSENALKLISSLNITTSNESVCFNSSPPGQNGRHFTDDTFNCIFLNENTKISIS